MALWDEPTEIHDDTVFGKRLNDKALQKMPDATGGSMTLLNPRYGLLSARNRGGVRPTLPNRDPENDRPGPDDRDLPSDFIADVDEQRNRFSPFQPVAPFGPPSILDVREWDYPTGYNLEIVNRHIVLGEMLRGIVRGSGIIANELSARVDELVSLPWKFVLKNPAKGVKSEDDPRIKELNAFFKMPDRKIPYPQWMEMIFRERYTIDAATVYIWKNRAGTKPYALEVIDGNTIVPKIDDRGRIPDWPSLAYVQCYSDDTEILTRRGWMKFDKLLPETDEFATRNPKTKDFEWQKSDGLVVRDHSGDMYHFHSQTIDLLVTPEHRMLVDRLPHAAGGHAHRSGDAILTAIELFETRTGATRIPITSRWEGTPISDKVFGESRIGQRKARDAKFRELRSTGMSYQAIADQEGTCIATAHKACTLYPDGKHPECPHDTIPVFMSGDEYASFMGAYLSEGSCNLSTGDTVAISQEKWNRGFNPYQNLLKKIAPNRKIPHVGSSFLLHSRPLVEHLKSFGHANDKFIPDEIMNATVEQLKLFWEYFWLGDGDKSRQRMFTSSKRMADQLQEIAQKMGYSASIREKKPSHGTINKNGVKRIITRGSQYTVSVRKTAAALIKKAEKISYSGKVWCPSVPSGIVYVRRNGLPSWCGNCVKGLPMDNFTEREIVYMPRHRWAQFPIFGYSEVEQILMEATQQVRKTMYMLNFWAEGTCPDVMVCCPENWTADQIALWQGTFDALMSGNLKLKSKMRFIPGGGKPFEMKGSAGDLLKSDYDEWMARIVCRAFRTDPKPYIKEPEPRANSEQLQEQMRAQGLNGEMLWWSSLMERLIFLGWGWDDIGHVFDQNEEVAATDQATIDTANTSLGARTINELRDRDGLDAVEGGDVPMVKTGTGWMPLAVLAAQKAMPQPAMGGDSGPGKPGAQQPSKNASVKKEAGTEADRPLAKRGSHWSRY